MTVVVFIGKFSAEFGLKNLVFPQIHRRRKKQHLVVFSRPCTRPILGATRIAHAA